MSETNEVDVAGMKSAEDEKQLISVKISILEYYKTKENESFSKKQMEKYDDLKGITSTEEAETYLAALYKRHGELSKDTKFDSNSADWKADKRER